MVTDNELIRRWDAGERMIDIALAVGLTRERVRQRLERHGRKGPNRNALPGSGELLAAAKGAGSLVELAGELKLPLHTIQLAVEQRGVRDEVQELLRRTREVRLEVKRRAAQQPYVRRIRQLALRVEHTPTQGELAEEGMYHVVLQRVFGSPSIAMIAAGLDPNVRGTPPQPLPPDFASDWEPTADPATLERRSNQLRRAGVGETPPAGNSQPAKKEITTTAYYRDPAVGAWVLESAEGVCEACGEPGYETDDDLLFLEVHHVVALAEGGPDVVTNAIAVCETCHGKLHRWKYRETLRDDLYEKIPRLVRF